PSYPFRDMHDDATQLAAFSLASFALVAALVPLVGDMARTWALSRQDEDGKVRTLAPDMRFLVELVVCCVLFAVGIRVRLVDTPVDFVLTVAWLVVTAHAFSVVDATVDGAAAVVATGVAIAVTIVAALQGQMLVGDV